MDISTFEELVAIEQRGEYDIQCDIDCNANIVSSICSDFAGVINGHGHTISNLIVEEEICGDETQMGLFHTLEKAKLSNITFDNITYRYDKDLYEPHISALAPECTKSVINNVKIVAMTSDENIINMIESAYHCEINECTFVCNNKDVDICKYED